MELGICYLYNINICGETDHHITNHYIIYETFPYRKIDTQRTINRKFKFMDNFRNRLSLYNVNNNVTIDIIRRINIIDGDGNIVSCAIYYTYLLRIIQKKWRKLLHFRKSYLSSQFINHLRKREVSTIYKTHSINSGLYGIFYRKDNSNFILG
jgi:hypothetical protein